VNPEVESSVPPTSLKPAQEIAEAGRTEEAAGQRAVEAKTARLKALRLAKEAADKSAEPPTKK